MSRIKTRFDALRATGRRALIPFVTAGDPGIDETVTLMHALVAAGADLIELGMPFSDPMADGPVIQKSSERALARGVTTLTVLDIVRRFRETDAETPVLLMGYLNPIEHMGYEVFAERAAAAGVDGVLTVDMPPEEDGGLRARLNERSMDAIYLLAPTSTPERIRLVCDAAGGFVYYVALKGVTGSANLQVDEVSSKLAELRQATSLPVGVGFGIRDAESAASMARVADAVIVGSALVQKIEAAGNDAQAAIGSAAELLAGMRRAMDAIATAA